jgi:pimeloyl-ACP methyl ester carboxylesterase
VRGFCGCAAAVRDLAQADLLPSIRVPTLVIVGEQDQATPPAAGEFIQQRIPGARIARLPAAHQSAVECPQAFAGAWEAFARPLS